MAKKRKIKYSGEEQGVSWDGRLCIHMGECGRAKGDLFVGGRDPWCDPNLANNAEAGHVVQACPTGALTLHGKDGSPIIETPPSENTLHITNNGPLYLSGDLKISGAPEDMTAIQRRVALCRCGASSNKPFCDGAHEGAGFKDTGAVGETGMALEDKGGPLEVTSFDDGPLEVKGNLTIHAGSGRKAWSGRKVYLCRCGASKNKPFCDGSHKDIGFKTT